MNYYVKSKQALEFYKLFDMIVGDKLKECLPGIALDYVLVIEGDSVLTSEKIASLTDIHSNNYTDGKYKGNVVMALDASKTR